MLRVKMSAKSALGIAFMVCVFTGHWPSVGWSQETSDQEKVLFRGFEKDELLKHFNPFRDGGKDKAHFFFPSQYDRQVYTMVRGISTQGEWSFAMSVGVGKLLPNPGKIRGWVEVDSASDVRWSPQYDHRGPPSFESGYLANTQPVEQFLAFVDKSEGRALESSSHHQHTLFYTGYVGDTPKTRYDSATFSTDWSGYKFLRMDLRPEKGTVIIRMAFEDDKVAPPIVRRFRVEPGKWSTLQIDLEQAVKERGLDPVRIVNFWLYLEETSAPTMFYLDNIRLSKQGVQPKYPVLTGGPKVARPVGEMPKIEVSNAVRNTATLSLEKPFAAPLAMENPKHDARLIVWAFDNDRIFAADGRLGYTSLDGGRNWTAWNEGHKKQTVWWWSYFDGSAWSRPMEVAQNLVDELVKQGKVALDRRGRPEIPTLGATKRYRAIGLPGRKEIFISTDVGILAYDAKSWRKDIEATAQLLTVAGAPGKEVVCAVGLESGKLVFRQRDSNGWSKARVIAEETPTVENMSIPQRSPENSYPLPGELQRMRFNFSESRWEEGDDATESEHRP